MNKDQGEMVLRKEGREERTENVAENIRQKWKKLPDDQLVEWERKVATATRVANADDGDQIFEGEENTYEQMRQRWAEKGWAKALIPTLMELEAAVAAEEVVRRYVDNNKEIKGGLETAGIGSYLQQYPQDRLVPPDPISVLAELGKRSGEARQLKGEVVDYIEQQQEDLKQHGLDEDKAALLLQEVMTKNAEWERRGHLFITTLAKLYRLVNDEKLDVSEVFSPGKMSEMIGQNRKGLEKVVGQHLEFMTQWLKEHPEWAVDMYKRVSKRLKDAEASLTEVKQVSATAEQKFLEKWNGKDGTPPKHN